MALVTISGYPCSGKSTHAASLADNFRARNYFDAIHIVSDDALHIPRSAYASSASEKPARGTLFSTLQRKLSSRDLVILDSMNYIKGFRYQIYCAARELKVRVCTIHILATPEMCKERNSTRPTEDQYANATLQNLIDRYEEPSSMVRWDSPLFTIPWDESLPFDDIWKALTEGAIKPPNSGTLAAAKAPTDALHTLEQTSAQMVSRLISHPSLEVSGELPLTLESGVRVVVCMHGRTPTLAELQRLKRQFVYQHKKAITLGSTERGAVDWSEERVAKRFQEYLEEQLSS
ncbi:chromatin associated protein KTI12 [Flagelloscypha sp. PMI_526]|nr:chromatin associated protein KTI12 [Flagelloscypha sp. PMI_526]